ncbi:hypothetical protein MGG_16017 [Pyricularia oryzae 70-15]|uniref:Uncharacterized protein n=2 Tax=Pyricularia oryzae TaxID=318829 RepID=G4MMW6_PYRO7|nr:uncharacterized protein MGG_16017 [Pyricularia oryzae 70-15]EHA56196.1 hypothetical protein MGG_16017 [Pyricularia oryzae 70-15]
MPFNCQNLTKEVPAHASNPPSWVEGRGQMVYFKDCWYYVYEGNNHITPIEKYENCSKQGKLPQGTAIFIGGGRLGNWWEEEITE